MDWLEQLRNWANRVVQPNYLSGLQEDITPQTEEERMASAPDWPTLGHQPNVPDFVGPLKPTNIMPPSSQKYVVNPANGMLMPAYSGQPIAGPQEAMFNVAKGIREIPQDFKNFPKNVGTIINPAISKITTPVKDFFQPAIAGFEGASTWLPPSEGSVMQDLGQMEWAANAPKQSSQTANASALVAPPPTPPIERAGQDEREQTFNIARAEEQKRQAAKEQALEFADLERSKPKAEAGYDKKMMGLAMILQGIAPVLMGLGRNPSAVRAALGPHQNTAAEFVEKMSLMDKRSQQENAMREWEMKKALLLHGMDAKTRKELQEASQTAHALEGAKNRTSTEKIHANDLAFREMALKQKSQAAKEEYYRKAITTLTTKDQFGASENTQRLVAKWQSELDDLRRGKEPKAYPPDPDSPTFWDEVNSTITTPSVGLSVGQAKSFGGGLSITKKSDK